MVDIIGKVKRYPVAYNNKATYKHAYTHDELEAALWRAERGIKRKTVPDNQSINMEIAIEEVLKEYWDSLGGKVV